MQILTEQQKAIIQNQAELLQDQQKELDLQGSKIKKLIEEKKEKQKGKRDDEENVINVDDDEKKIKVEPSTSSGSGSGGAFRLEDLFKRDVLEKFIPGYKTSQPETTDTTPTADFNFYNSTNPTLTNPTLTNPTLTNPTLTNPTLTNPTLTNPTLTNPTLTNPTLCFCSDGYSRQCFIVTKCSIKSNRV